MKKVFFGLIFLVVLAIVFSGCTGAGQAAGEVQALIKANSCDRDDICEINQARVTNEISSNGLTSNGLIKAYNGLDVLSGTATFNEHLLVTGSQSKLTVDGPAYLNGDVTTERVLSPSTLYLTSQTGYAKIEGDLTLTKIGQQGGVVFKTDNSGTLTIEPQSGTTIVDSFLTINEGAKIADGLRVESGELEVDTLGGEGDAYVCVHGDGKLFRSTTPCT